MNIYEIAELSSGKLIEGFKVLNSKEDQKRFSERAVTINVGGWENCDSIDQVAFFTFSNDLILEAKFQIIDQASLKMINRDSLKHNCCSCTENDRLMKVAFGLNVEPTIKTINKNEPLGLLVGRHIAVFSRKSLEKLTIFSEILMKDNLEWISHSVNINDLSASLEVL